MDGHREDLDIWDLFQVDVVLVFCVKVVEVHAVDNIVSRPKLWMKIRTYSVGPLMHPQSKLMGIVFTWATTILIFLRIGFVN